MLDTLRICLDWLSAIDARTVGKGMEAMVAGKCKGELCGHSVT